MVTSLAMAFFHDKLLGLVLFAILVSECQLNLQFGCPNQFQSIGRKCYFFSNVDVNWFDAYYSCQSLNSTLVPVKKLENADLIKFLNENSQHKKYWTSARWNSRKKRWYDGKTAQLLIIPNKSISNKNGTVQWDCLTFDPKIQNIWEVENSLSKKSFICETNNKCEDKQMLTKREKNLCQKDESAPGLLRDPVHICPLSEDVKIENTCYWFSKIEKNWFEAYTDCKQNGSELAILDSKQKEKLLQYYLNSPDGAIDKQERWIGAKFHKKSKKWIWGRTGHNQLVCYQDFAEEVIDQNPPNYAIILDPSYENRWSCRNLSEKKHYICEFNPNDGVDKNKEENKSNQCPLDMILIGSLCYFFSTTKENWSDANKACKSKKTELAMLRSKDNIKILRDSLNSGYIEKQERWIGAKFDKKDNEWVWAETNQKQLCDQIFDNTVNKRNQTNHAIVLDPIYKNRWNSRNVSQKKRYICQAKPKQQKQVDKNKEENKSNQCPLDMILIGSLCYFFSTTEENWSDANKACKSKKTELAMLRSKNNIKVLRDSLNSGYIEKQERWIGAKFDERDNEWVWAGTNQNQLCDQNFAKAANKRNQIHHAIILDPIYQNQKKSRNVNEKKHYICQKNPNKLFVSIQKEIISKNRSEESGKFLRPSASIIIKKNKG